MKTKILSIIILLLVFSQFVAKAQWTTSGTNIYNTNSGNVGIGLSSPTGKLEILGPGSSSSDNLVIKNNDNSSFIRIYGAGNSQYTLSGFLGHRSRGTTGSPTSLQTNDRIVAFGANGYINGAYQSMASMEMNVGSSPGVNSYPCYIIFYTTPNNGTSRLERLRIAESGDVGVGTTTPSYRLHVNGSVGATSYTTISDERFKQNIKGIMNPLDKITQIEGHSYTFNTSKFKERNFPGGERVGFLAQEIQKVFPDLVTMDSEGYLGVDYNGLIPVMLEAIKELKSQIDHTRELLVDQSITGSDQPDEQGYVLRNYPNPTGNNISTIEYASPDIKQQPSIVIYDLLGKQVKTFFNLKSGHSRVEVNTSEFDPGIYLFSLVVNGEAKLTKRMVVVR